MRRSLALAAAAASWLLFPAAALPGPAFGAADLPPELPGLLQEGKRWFNEAGNTDRSRGERNDALVKAWKALWPAKEMLDKHDEAHPEDQDRIDDKYGEVRMMVFWIKKESPLGLLEGTGIGPKHDDEGSGGTNTSGQRRQSDWPDKPPEERTGDAPGAPARPVTPPAPGTAPPPPSPSAKPPGPPEPKRATLEEAFKAAEEYEKKHRRDHAGIHARYLSILTTYPETGSDLFRRAAERAGAVEAKLKDAYRVLRNEDPDSLKGMEDGRVKGMVVVVGHDLDSRDSAVRERAARLLGVIGRGEGVFALAKAFKKEAEPQARQVMGDSLVRIGGGKSADALADLKDEKDLAPTVLDLLLRIAGKNPVDKRVAAFHLGRFSACKDPALAGKAVQSLVDMGPEGAKGLGEALKGTYDVDIRIKILEALGRTKDPRVAREIVKYLIAGDVPNTIRTREAATLALKEMAKPDNCGEAIVPYVLEGLRGGSTKAYTALLLRDITGQMFSMSRPGDWWAWWKQKHPEWKGDADNRD